MNIKAAQHIFTNVEQEDSPNRERGFQTLYYTKDKITDDEKMILEERAFFWATQKIQFYKIGKKFVITNIVPLQGADKYGGEGLYLSHALIFTEEEFNKVENNPLVILKAARDIFCTTTDSAISRGEFDTGNIDPVDIKIFDDAVDKFNKKTSSRLYFWKQEEVKKLTALALSSKEMNIERESLRIVGFHKEIVDVLRFVFFMLPVEMRGDCSFDTNCYNPRIRIPYFWAGGFFEEQTPESEQYILVKSGTVEKEVDSEKVSPYLNWLFSKIDNRDYRSIQENNSFIYRLEKIIAEPENISKKIQDIPRELVEEFVKSNHSLIKLKIMESLYKYVGKTLGEKVYPLVFEKYKDQPDELLKIISGNIDDFLIADLFFKYMPGASPDDFKEDLLSEAEDLFNRTQSLPLQAVLYFHRNEYRLLRESVNNLNEKEFEQFLKATVNFTSNFQYFKCIVNKRRINTILDTFIKTTKINPGLTEKIPNLLAMLTQCSVRSYLEKLEPVFNDLSTEKIDSIIKNAQSQKISLSEEISSFIEPDEESLVFEKTKEETKEKKTGSFLNKIWPFSK